MTVGRTSMRRDFRSRFRANAGTRFERAGRPRSGEWLLSGPAALFPNDLVGRKQPLRYYSEMRSKGFSLTDFRGCRR
jgi:hypothetical protein